MNKIGLTTTVVSDLAWEQLVQIDNPPNTPVAATVAGVAPVQSWEETDQVLPDIGDVDNKLLGAAGLSNTILISTTTKAVLETITVSIGANGNWYVGIQDTGIAAKGTDEKTIARPTGVYGSAVVYRQGNDLHIGGGLTFCTKEGPSYYTMTTTAELVIPVTNTTTFVTIDRFGTTRTYDASVNLWLIPESQALIALVVDVVDGVNVLAVPTVHNAMLMATAVIPYSQEAITAAATATTQAILASQQAAASAASATAAALSESNAAATAVQVTADKLTTLGYRNDAQSAAAAAATSEQNAHTFADYADADRVATNADRAQVAADKAVADAKATEAAGSAGAASSSATAAGNSASLAAEWSSKAEDSAITGNPGKYSAFHWAQKAQQWAGVVGSALMWKGSWNASTGAPPTPTVGTGVPFYRITVGGTINSVSYLPGDYIHWDIVGLQWFKVDGTDSVTSVNGLYGDVVLNAANVGAAPSTHVGAGSNTAHPDATTSVSGFMTAADKTKLNGVATGANNYVHPTGDGNQHIPVTGTSRNGQVLVAGATAGSAAWRALVATDIPDVLAKAGGQMSGSILVALKKSAITVNGQSSISYKDSANTMFHHLAFGNSLAIAKNDAGDTNIWTINPNGLTQQNGPVYARTGLISQSTDGTKWISAESPDGADPYIGSRGVGEATTSVAIRFGSGITIEKPVTHTKGMYNSFNVSRNWNSYGVANYRAEEITSGSGALRAALSYPFKITGVYAVDAYIGTYANGGAATDLTHILGATDGGTFNRMWMLGLNGSIAYKTDAVGTTGTIASTSPMTAPSFTPTSDSRLKPEDTREDIVDATSFIKQLRAKLFFKKFAIDSEQGQMEYGLIADDVEPLKKHLVRIIGEDKLKCLDWTGISAHLVAAFNELEQRVTTLEGANG